MDFAKRPMKGYIYVDKTGTTNGRSLAKWVRMGTDFASTLPAETEAVSEERSCEATRLVSLAFAPALTTQSQPLADRSPARNVRSRGSESSLFGCWPRVCGLCRPRRRNWRR